MSTNIAASTPVTADSEAMAWIARFDRFQQRHRALSFALAVRQKYAEDQGGLLSASIAFYAFLSLFPLLLVLTSVLGFVIRAYPGLRRSIVDSALAQFPIIGHELHAGALHGSALALGLGIAGSLWAGLGGILAAENAMSQIWGTPFARRPDPVRARVRGVGVLVVLGGAILATTIVGGVATFGAQLGIGWEIASILLSTALNVPLVWLGLKLLTAGDVSWRDLRGGAICTAVLYELLQLLGGFYVGHVVRSASNTYGTFALVVGLLSWLYLAAQVLLLGAEINVVAARRLWPRSFSAIVERPLTPADVEALVQRGNVEERRSDETVEVTFTDTKDG
jgi:YihY family inner membrane protein